jgi:dsRNA-specific ribonuclease
MSLVSASQPGLRASGEKAAHLSWRNLARRDDEKPHLLWVQTPSMADPTSAQACLEEELSERISRELASFGYCLVAQGGPSHQPLFTVAAWAELPGGERLEGKAVEAPSKKAAERAAASERVAVLSDRGIVA